jgi:hypothetical protein
MIDTCVQCVRQKAEGKISVRNTSGAWFNIEIHVKCMDLEGVDLVPLAHASERWGLF